jgi:transposase
MRRTTMSAADRSVRVKSSDRTRDDGARANAIFTSLLASCRMLDVEPLSYLRDIFWLIPRWPAYQLLELAPVNWAATSQREDVRALLGADPYRAATLRRA